MTQDRYTSWKESLLLPGESDPTHSVLRELSEYYGISEDEARAACESALSDSKREWETAERRSEAQILDFYDRTRAYIFEHLWWHAHDLENNSVNAAIIEYARQQGARDYLDFGSGVGSNGILAARHGLNVTLADVSATMLEFARWRMERRQLNVSCLYLREKSLPREAFDLVTAMDVLEHLKNPTAEIARLAESVKDGGLLIFNARPGFDAERPMHILMGWYPVYRALRTNGLSHAKGAEAAQVRNLDCFVLRRCKQNELVRLGWRMYDSFRYSRLAELGSSLVNRAAKARHQQQKTVHH